MTECLGLRMPALCVGLSVCKGLRSLCVFADGHIHVRESLCVRACLCACACIHVIYSMLMCSWINIAQSLTGTLMQRLGTTHTDSSTQAKVNMINIMLTITVHSVHRHRP